MKNPRRFYLERALDVSGISGTGRIADGVEWADGTVSLRWHGPTPKVDFADGGIATIEAVHGHGGATVIVWIDQDLCIARVRVHEPDVQHDPAGMVYLCHLSADHPGRHEDPAWGPWPITEGTNT